MVGHVLVQGVDPILMTEARWALTALLLGLLYRRQIAASRHLLRENAPAVLVLTLCGQVSFPLTLYIGLQTTLRPQRRHLYVRHAKHGAAD